jgi:hypothetical protein
MFADVLRNVQVGAHHHYCLVQSFGMRGIRNLPNSNLGKTFHAALSRHVQNTSTISSIMRWKGHQPTPIVLHGRSRGGLGHRGCVDQGSSLRAELCVRLSSSAAHFVKLPHGWFAHAPFSDIIDLHHESISLLENCYCPSDRDQGDHEQIFEEVIKDIAHHPAVNVATVLQRVRALLNERLAQDQPIPPQLNDVLIKFFTLRAGMRMLVERYLQAQSNRASDKAEFDGLLQNQCMPAEVAQLAASASRNMCRDCLGQAPQIIVQGDLSAVVAYAPKVLQYMLTEIFKNACRAVVERHSSFGFDDALPPVVCTITSTSENLMIKVKDAGSGMSEKTLDNVWDFFYSTSSKSAWKARGRQDIMAGFGVGLPLSRMYARYFGGDLLASSQEGVGTEVCIVIDRAGPLCEVLP